jgi:hypothetical protein
MNLLTRLAVASLALAGLLSAGTAMSYAADAPSLDGTTATLRFEGGRAGGSAGCNNFMGTYRASGSSLTFGPAAATASQEGNRLELRRADGALAVSLARGPAS